jgi:general secretion pathway protein F
MATFTYKAMDPQYRFITGEIEAANLREVTSELEKLGYVVLDTGTGAKSASTDPGFFSFRRPVGRREITVFLRELSLVLRAGLTLDDALPLLAGEEGAGLAAIVRDLRAAITAGASFGDALQRYPRLFGPDLVAMVRVAEATGNLDGVLESVGEERARTERLMDKVSSALRYPAVLMIVALSVLVFFLVYVVPQFASVLRDFGQPPEGFVGAVLATSDFFVSYGSTMAGILAVLLAAGLVASRFPQVRIGLQRRINRMPGLRGILELRRTVLFCSSLSTLLTNGVTLTNALRVLVDLPGAVAAGLDTVVENVRRGGRLVDALARSHYVPPLALKMLRVGEDSGEIAIVARRTAEFYEAKLADRLDRLAGVVGPAAIVAIAAIVGSLIVSILSALLSVNQLIG